MSYLKLLGWVPAIGTWCISYGGVQRVLVSSTLATIVGYFVLMKPRVIFLVAFTAFVGMSLAPCELDAVELLPFLFSIAIGAGGAGAINMWWDADIDAVMPRTKFRPIPGELIHPSQALAFGITLSISSVMLLGLLANRFAAALLVFSILSYVVVYTIWLKRSTAQSVVIGGTSGALSPIIGWVAVSESISVEPFILFLIIFFWTPPHFWSLALMRADEYAKAGVPVLPVVATEKVVILNVLVYSFLFVATSFVPVLVGFVDPYYLAVSIPGGAVFLWFAVDLWYSGVLVKRVASRLFSFSICYLFCIYTALVLCRSVVW